MSIKNNQNQCQLSEKDEYKRIEVLSSASKATSRYKSFYNTQNEGDANPTITDFDYFLFWKKKSLKMLI